MNRNGCFCLLLIIALGDKASSATQSDDAVKALMERYQQVEAQLDRSIRYSVTSWKWGYNRCTAAKVSSAGKLLDPVDLGKYAEKTARAYLATHKGPKYNGSIDVSVAKVTAGDVVNLTILGQGTSGDHKGDVFFSLDESVRVRETPSGLGLETVSIHASPEN